MRIASLLGKTALIVGVCILVYSCATTSSLPPGVVDSSEKELPEWTKDTSQTDGCSAGYICVVGTSSGLATKEQALRKARFAGYLRLAERAFPIEIVQDYKARRDSDQGSVSEELAANLSGRLKGAQSLAEFWVKRRVYDVSGFQEVFDSWALVKMKQKTLEGLFKREMERTRNEGDAIRQVLTSLENAIESGTEACSSFSEWAQILSEAEKRIGSFQNSETKSELRRQIALIKNRLSSVFSVNVVGSRKDFIKRRVQVSLGAFANGVRICGAELSVESSCIPLPAVKKTDSNGEVGIWLVPLGFLHKCEIKVALGAIDSISVNLAVPSLVDRVVKEFAADISGYSSDAVRAVLQKEAFVVLRESSSDFAVRVNGGDELHLRITVEGRIEQARRISRRAYLAGGSLVFQMIGVVGDVVVSRVTSQPKVIKGVGLDGSQILDGLKLQAVGALRDFVHSQVGSRF